MTRDELKILAKENRFAIPKDISLTESGYYSRIKEIILDFKSGKISSEKCVEAVQAVDRQFDAEVEEKINAAHRYTVFQTNIQLAGTLRSEINKSTDIKEIAKLAIKCISFMTGDEPFKDNIKKIGSE